MAVTLKEILVRLGADTKEVDKALDTTGEKSKKFGDTFFSMGKKIAAVVSVGLITKFFKDSAKLAGEQELALKKLSSALQSTGQDAIKLTPHIASVSSEIQKLTIFGDEVLIALAATATNMGITGEQMEGAQKAAIGLSTAFAGAGLNLNTALKGFALALEGDFTQLQRYIPELKTAKTEAEKMAIVQKAAAAGFEQAKAEAETFSGRLQQLKNTFGDFQEQVGDAIIKNQSFKDALAKIKGLFEDPAFANAIGEIAGAITEVAAILLDVLVQNKDLIVGAIKGIAEAIKILAEVAKFAIDIIGDFAHAAAGIGDIGRIAVDAIKEEIGEQEELNKKMEEFNKLTGETISTTKKFESSLKFTEKEARKLKKEITELKEILVPTKNVFQAFKGPLETFDEYFERIHQDVMPGVNLQMFAVKETTKDTGEEIEGTGEKGESLSEVFTSLATTTENAFKAIEQLGLDLGILPGLIQSVLGGLNSLGAGLNAISNMGKSFTSILSGISGGFTVLTGIISTVSGILSALSGPSGELEAARRRMQGLQMNTEGWGERIETLAKQLGGAESAGRAFNALLADMIRDSDISVESFGNYITKVREIVSVYERGNATIQETEKNFGAAFEAIVEAARGLGIEGSQSIRALIELADEFGLSVQEINDYINESKDTALAGWTEAIKTFGDFSLPIFDDMLALQERISDNQQLIDSIHGANEAMMNLAKTPDFNATQFDVFQQIAVDAMDRLKESGFSAAQAMESDAGLRGMLQNIIFLSEQYGFKVDDATQALIDQGIASGALTKQQESEADIMMKGFEGIIGRMDELIGLMRGDLPDSIEGMARRSSAAIDAINKSTSAWNNSLGQVYDGIYDVADGIQDMGDIHDQVMRRGSIIPDLEDWQKENYNIENQIKDEMVSSILGMGNTFSSSMTGMMESSGQLYDQMTDDIDALRSMYDALGESAFISGIGTSRYERYGVGVEERDTEKFAELQALWDRNWKDITKSQEGLENFIGDLGELDVIDQLEGDLTNFINWVTYSGEKISEGLVWDPTKFAFVKPENLTTFEGGVHVPGISVTSAPGERISRNLGSDSPRGPSSVTNAIYNTFNMDANVNQDLYSLARNMKTVMENDLEGVRTDMIDMVKAVEKQ